MKNDLPLVSIVIPVYNNAEGLKRTLAAISQQDYPVEKTEIIVIDNGSVNSPEHVANACNAIFLTEKVHLKSPYSARNRGIEISKGTVIALLDTTCAPVPHWLSAAIDCLVNEQADMVGGNVQFEIAPESSVGEMYDSLTNIRMQDTILKRNAAKTTNLFIRKLVFDRIGMFPEGLRSGGDVLWTKKATSAGFKLMFCKDASALMLPRGGWQLYRKQFRVAKGQPAVWKKEHLLFKNLINKVLLCWLPPNPISLKNRINESGHVFMKKKFLALFLMGYSLRIVNAMGNISGLLKTSKNEK